MVGSTAADTLVVDFTAAYFTRGPVSSTALTTVNANLGAGADALDVRLPADADNAVFGGSAGADLDADAASRSHLERRPSTSRSRAARAPTTSSSPATAPTSAVPSTSR